MKPTRDQQMISEIVQKAWGDESFKKLLIENPIEAIEQVTGQPLNLNGRKLVVRDQTDPDTLFINIPAKNSMEDAELTEDQLDYVSGGGNLTTGGLFPSGRGNG